MLSCVGDSAQRRVGDGVGLVQDLEVGEVVDVDLVLQDHDDAISAQSHGPDLDAEGELADAPALVVVPDHHLVRGVSRRSPAAHEREDVAAEEHLDLPDPAAVEAPAEGFLEWVAVVDAEAPVGAAREAAAVLVEGQREELLCAFCGAERSRSAHPARFDPPPAARRCRGNSSHNSPLRLLPPAPCAILFSPSDRAFVFLCFFR